MNDERFALIMFHHSSLIIQAIHHSRKLISQKSVNEILETAKVEEVIEDFVNLKRRGVNMIGLCPFHSEKTPSFTVSPSKNIYKCFGCGKAGNSVQFVMDHENFNFPEALKYLAKKYGIKVEETQLSQEVIAERQKQDSLYLVNDYAKMFFQNQLLNTDRGKSIGLSYFKGRGFRQETIKKFGLGYAPATKDAFTSQAVQQGYNIELLRQLGLTSKYNSDFFRDRVMFTIHNLTGKPIAFAGRILQKNVKAPKYINSPETEIYTKSKVLYGAFFAKKAIRKEDECILVEGYTDVISLHQAGVENVVASSGTSLTEGQIRLIKRYTPNIKILYDGDPAGIKAALRGLDMVLGQDMNVKVVLLPNGEDPDSYMQKVGVTAFKQFITDKAKDFILFKTDLLLDETKNDPIKKAQIIKDIVMSVARIPDPIKRSLYIRECAQKVEVEENILVTEMNKLIRVSLAKQKARQQAMPPPPTAEPNQTDIPGVTTMPTEIAEPKEKGFVQTVGDEFQERHIAQILIASGGEPLESNEEVTVAEYILSNIEDVLEDFDNKIYQRIVKECYQLLLDEKPVTEKHFTHHADPELSKVAIGLITSPYVYSEGWEKRWEIVLTTQKMPELNFNADSERSLMRFKLRKVMKMCEKNQEDIKRFAEAGDMENMMLHLKVQQRLNEARNALAKEWGTVILK